jgi:methyl-accepting chemotaxis protein
MASLLSEALTIEGKGLRNKLTVISSLVFLLPFLGLSYILCAEGLFFRLGYSYAIIIGHVLVLSLTGLVILRNIFDRFAVFTHLIKRAEAGEMVTMDPQKDTAEFRDMAAAFNRIMKRLDATSRQLEEKTMEVREAAKDVEHLNRLMVGRELRMEELKKEIGILRARLEELEGLPV